MVKHFSYSYNACNISIEYIVTNIKSKLKCFTILGIGLPGYKHERGDSIFWEGGVTLKSSKSTILLLT